MRNLSKYLIAVAAMLLLVGLPTYCFGQTDTILVRYGNINASPIDVDINQRVEIPVFVYTGVAGYVGDLHFAVGTNNQYIDSLLSETEGEVLYPLTEWDAYYWSEPYGSPPNPEGWSSQALFGWARLSPFSDAPWLHTNGLQVIARFMFKTADDQLNIGDDALAIGPGLSSPQGPSNAGDTLGLLGFVVNEQFSIFHFTGGGYVEGTVTDYVGNTLEGVSVVCDESGKQVFTDADGFYHMGHYPGDNLNFTFSLENYVSETEQTNIVEDVTQTIDVSLDRLGEITGTVRDYLDNPIEGVEVTLATETVTTGSDGVYTFAGLEAGSYDITFSHPDYVDVTVEDVVAALNVVTTQDVVMNMLAGVSGTVTFAGNGEPIAGIIVTVVGTQIEDVTDASGNYSLDLVEPGTYDIFFEDTNNIYEDTTVVDIVIEYNIYTDLNVAMGLHVGINGDDNLPLEFSLNQNYPNPFNAKTTIEYALDKDAYVTMEIYDVLGRRVETLVNEYKSAGYYKAVWNAGNMTSGMYFYKLQAGDQIEQRAMMLLK